MPNPARILLVDADAVLCASLAEQLAREDGCEAVTAGTAAEARAAVQAGPFAFAIIDRALPDMDGESLASQLRGDGIACPILLLAQNGETSGLFETLAKPFRVSVLLARLHALTAQHGEIGEAVTIGPYVFHPNAKLLQDGGRKVRLTEKETNILKFLHANAGTVPRDILLHEVWGYSPAVTTHTLETHIYRLRKKIEQDPTHAQILLTESGGYRLCA
jgi:DNA-binding response OmpR family regulator